MCTYFSINPMSFDIWECVCVWNWILVETMCSNSSYIKSSHITHLFAIFQSMDPATKPPPMCCVLQFCDIESHNRLWIVKIKIVVAYMVLCAWWLLSLELRRNIKRNVRLFQKGRVRVLCFGDCIFFFGNRCCWMQKHNDTLTPMPIFVLDVKFKMILLFFYFQYHIALCWREFMCRRS